MLIEELSANDIRSNLHSCLPKKILREAYISSLGGNVQSSGSSAPRVSFTIKTDFSRSPNTYERQDIVKEAFVIKIQLYSAEWHPFNGSGMPEARKAREVRKNLDKTLEVVRSLKNRLVKEVDLGEMKVLDIQTPKLSDPRQKPYTEVVLAGVGGLTLKVNGKITKIINAAVSIPAVKPVRPLSEFRPPDQLPVDTRKRSSEELDPSVKRPRSDEGPADSPVVVPTPSSVANVDPYLPPNTNLPTASAYRTAHSTKRVQIQGNGWISFSPSVNQPTPPAGSQTGDTISISGVIGEAGSVTQRAVLPIGSELNKGFRAKNGTIYHTLEEITAFTHRANGIGAIGVVGHIDGPSPPTRNGRDWMISLVLTDPSNAITSEQLVLAIFRRDSELLKDKFKIGDVLLCRNCFSTRFNDKSKLNCGSNNDQLFIWRGGPQPINPSEYRKYPLGDDELERMKALWGRNTASSTGEQIVNGMSGNKTKLMCLANVEVGNFFDCNVKRQGPALEVYITDGTCPVREIQVNHNFHGLTFGLPPKAVFCVAIDDFSSEAGIEHLKMGNVVKIPNLHCKMHRESSSVEIFWANRGTATQNFRERKIYPVIDEAIKADIERKIKDLRAKETAITGIEYFEPEQEMELELEPARLAPAIPSGKIPETKQASIPSTDQINRPALSTTDSSATAISTIIPITPLVQPADCWPALHTIYRHPTKHPLSTLSDIAEFKEPAKLRTIAKVDDIFSREETGGREMSRDVVLSGGTSLRSETNQPRLLSNPALKQEEWLPPLPPYEPTTNPRDKQKTKQRLEQCCKEVRDILMGEEGNDGRRPHPWIDWTLEPYIVKYGKVVQNRIFGMKRPG
ncbi:hypothetical protein I309_02722 [Cryptococcus deuterogattii LA55]|nr:hypothetical protein I309_02722 [Cryptococcus deuterogattii LA55]KIR34963.1 hypothetical protein I352_02219 [Cryptococcus deuterogattii MMRL2647]KIR70102.1 hypothetical protein I310_06084 [Cryptococcus deuterogattii CA1014]KIR93901.1 hypothetical protein I304_02588 [Cryptococcus deuterogattii CBS 10090]KIS00169.1 hypothetical protein L804_02817 [Cryptococcus deuterogattii 2001/935-1]